MYSKSFWFYERDKVIPEDLYPVEASNYILNNLDIENMRIYNDFNWGSYLEFRGIKAFIDSRSGMFCDEFNPGVTILEDWLAVSDETIEYNEIFKKYDITHILVRNNEDLYNNLEEDKLWNLIYEDEYFTLYEKK